MNLHQAPEVVVLLVLDGDGDLVDGVVLAVQGAPHPRRPALAWLEVFTLCSAPSSKISVLGYFELQEPSLCSQTSAGQSFALNILNCKTDFGRLTTLGIRRDTFRIYAARKHSIGVDFYFVQNLGNYQVTNA